MIADFAFLLLAGALFGFALYGVVALALLLVELGRQLEKLSSVQLPEGARAIDSPPISAHSAPQSKRAGAGNHSPTAPSGGLEATLPPSSSIARRPCRLCERIRALIGLS